MTEIFTPVIRQKADALVSQYEHKRASLLEILRLLQEEYGHITLEMEKAVSEYLEIPSIDVREVMTFYSLFYSAPKAQTRFHVCRTLSCVLAGGDRLLEYFEKKLGIKCGETTRDRKFSLHTVECLGACEISPMLQKNDTDYVGPLSEEKINQLIDGK